MSDRPPSTFMNQYAEQCVLLSVLKYRGTVLAQFEALSVEDFTHSEFGVMFARMRELAATGIPITAATINCKLTDEEIGTHGYDSDDDYAGLVAAIKRNAHGDGAWWRRWAWI